MTDPTAATATTTRPGASRRRRGLALVALGRARPSDGTAGTGCIVLVRGELRTERAVGDSDDVSPTFPRMDQKEPNMADTQVVLAIFPDEVAADAAVEELKVWDKISSEKLDAIGVLVLDENGKVKDQKLGRKTVGKGAGIGLALPC